MVLQIKKVAVAGPNGNTGPTVVKTLVASGFEVTAVTRSLAKTRDLLGPDIDIIEVDYLSQDSLVSALKGIDAVVVCGVGMLPEQTNLIDAAIAAGVRRFLPASLDADISNPVRRSFPFVKNKVIVEEYLKSRESVISHTSIRTGPLLDYVLSLGAIINMREHSMTRFDDGEKKFSTATIQTASKAVAAVLRMGKEAENREFWVHDIVTSQNELLKWGKEVVPDAEWTVTPASTEDMAKKVVEASKVDPESRMVDTMFKALAIFGKELNSVFEEASNEVLGIGMMGESEVKEMLRSFADAVQSSAGEHDAATINKLSSSGNEE